MPNILLCITEGQDVNDEWRLHLASNIVEALTFTDGGQNEMIPTIFVVADPETSLEIGLSTIGRGDPRTLEGGARRRAPVVMVPIRGRSWDFDEVILRKRSEDSEERGALDILASLGAVEEINDSLGWADCQNRSMKKAVDIIMEHIENEHQLLGKVLFVGDAVPEAVLARFASDHIIHVTQQIDEDDTAALLRQLYWLGESGLSGLEDQMGEGETEQSAKRISVKEAMRLAALLDQLNNIDDFEVGGFAV